MAEHEALARGSASSAPSERAQADLARFFSEANQPVFDRFLELTGLGRDDVLAALAAEAAQPRAVTGEAWCGLVAEILSRPHLRASGAEALGGDGLGAPRRPETTRPCGGTIELATHGKWCWPAPSVSVAQQGEAMDQKTLVRAWRDPVFRSKLPEADLLEMPEHPAGGEAKDQTDWSQKLGVMSIGEACMITFGGGCTTPGCTAIVCTEPCGSLADGCPKRTDPPRGCPE